MTTYTSDPFWSRSTIGCDAKLAPWLYDHGSLTKSIQKSCDKFSVQVVSSGKSRIAYEESALLGIRPQHFAYSREVFLFADNQPVVFAHSTCAVSHLRGTWGTIRGLGSRPLGAMLFAHPQIKRRPLCFKMLRYHHPLYHRASEILSDEVRQLWARRSLFYLHGAPLLVTEVFLPGVLHLDRL